MVNHPQKECAFNNTQQSPIPSVTNQTQGIHGDWTVTVQSPLILTELPMEVQLPCWWQLTVATLLLPSHHVVTVSCRRLMEQAFGCAIICLSINLVCKTVMKSKETLRYHLHYISIVCKVKLFFRFGSVKTGQANNLKKFADSNMYIVLN